MYYFCKIFDQKTETIKNNFDMSSTKKEIESFSLISLKVTVESIKNTHSKDKMDVINKTENNSIHFVFLFLK